MSVTITNATDKLVLLRLKSGRTQYLAPNETVEDLEKVEIEGNDRIKRLEDRRVISVLETPAKSKLEEKRSRRSKDSRPEAAGDPADSSPERSATS